MSAPTAADPGRRFPPPPPAKFCGGCRRVRSAREFWRRAASADGLQSRCKRCQRTARHETARRWRGPTAAGEWRCNGCERWLRPEAYRANTGATQNRHAPRSCCAACQRAAARDKRRLADAGERERALRAHDRANAKRRRRTAAERDWRRRWMAETVRQLHAAGWTQATLARAWRVEPETVMTWRLGAVVPNQGHVEAVLAWLERHEDAKRTGGER